MSGLRCAEFAQRKAVPGGTRAALWLACLLGAGWQLVPVIRADDAGERLEAFTGAHSRVVWVQDLGEAQDDTLARGRKLRLMGLDSRDGRGERPLRTAVQNYAKPLLTPDGSAVVYSDHFSGKVYVVDWRSGEQRELCSGFALDVWADPVTGATWVYTATRAKPREEYIYRQVRRQRIDAPTKGEPVWSATTIGPDNFQLSADGLRAAGEFPWPEAGVADLARGTWKKRATGCWASLAPDNSGLCAVFDGPHRNWQMRRADDSKPWTVNLNGAPGIDGHEVFHPRWSNHVRYLALTGPYAVKGALNFISGGGPRVELLIGRLSPEFDKVDAWLQVTRNDRADFHPDLWIAGGELSSVPAAVAGDTAPPSSADTKADPRTVFVWRDARSQNTVTGVDSTPRACRMVPRGAALFDRHFALHLRGGDFVADEQGAGGLARCAASGEYTFAFAVTPDTLGKGGVGTVLAVTPETGEPLLAVEQNGRRLLARFPPNGSDRPVRIPIGEFSGVRPHSVVLSFGSGELRIGFQGEAGRREKIALASPAAWSAAELRIGSAGLSGEGGWRGRVERIRLDDVVAGRGVFSVEARDLAAELAGRRPVEQVRLIGRVRETTPVPALESIVPYRRALVVHDLEVEEVLSGRLDSGRVLVARWGLVDGREVHGAVPPVGDRLELTLEPVAGHPELESERQLLETEALEWPLFLDVGQELKLAEP